MYVYLTENPLVFVIICDQKNPEDSNSEVHRDLKPENILLCGNSPKKARKSGQESPEAAAAIIYDYNLFMQLYVCHEMSRKNWLCVIEIKKW